MYKIQIGSMTAKGGFINELEICNKFKSWKSDIDAQKWLSIMGYEINKIRYVNAIQIPVRISKEKAIDLGVSPQKFEETIKYKKADLQIKLQILIEEILYIENLSLKKANNSAGFNQIDKRPVKTYKKMWNFDNDTEYWLRAFTGDILPEKILKNEKLKNVKSKKRLFLTEIPPEYVNKIINFFSNNKVLVVSDIIRGRGGLSAEWLLVTKKT